MCPIFYYSYFSNLIQYFSKIVLFQVKLSELSFALMLSSNVWQYNICTSTSYSILAILFYISSINTGKFLIKIINTKLVSSKMYCQRIESESKLCSFGTQVHWGSMYYCLTFYIFWTIHPMRIHSMRICFFPCLIVLKQEKLAVLLHFHFL